MRVALFGKKIDEKSMEDFAELMRLLNRRQEIEWSFYLPFYERYKEKVQFPSGIYFHDYSDLESNTDLFLSLGGDGTILESLTLVRDKKIPVAGINFGRLGFLTTESVDDKNLWIEQLLSKSFAIEKRTLLRVENSNLKDYNPDKSLSYYPFALNEVSVQRLEPAMLEIHVKIDGESIPVYWADGILIATATGSTAYSLSVGGPVVTPGSKVLVIAPIAPHNLNVRPLVVPESSKIEISFTGRVKEAQLTMDNRYFKIKKDETVVVQAADYTLDCVTLNNNFFRALNEKLLWGEDKRNSRKSSAI